MKSLASTSLTRLGLTAGLVGAALLGFSFSAQAQTTGDTVITVIINNICQFNSVPGNKTDTYNNASSIPTAAQTLGDLNITCTDADGFEVTATSLNDGKLVDGIIDLAYTISTSGSGAPASGVTLPINGGATIYTQTGFNTTCGSTTGCNAGVTFTVTPETVPAGTYTDTITYTLSAL
jgi:hypothetical protein